MNIIPTPPEPESLAALHERNARQLCGVLMELAAMGTEMARLYQHQAGNLADAVKPAAGTSSECAAAYATVTRSVRQTAMLIQKLTTPAPKSPDAAPNRAATRKQIIRRVEESIYREAEAPEAERLRAELQERLEAPEFDDDLANRPVEAIIDEIRADLGINGADSQDHWPRRTPADIALLCARAAAPCRASGQPPRAPVWQNPPPIRGP